MTDPPPLSSLPRTLRLVFRSGGDPEASRRLETWVQELEQASSGRLHAQTRSTADSMHGPALEVPCARGSRISYHFVPEGPERQAFLDLIRAAAERDPEEGPRPPPPLPHGTQPLPMLLFVTNPCPNCPRAVRAVHALAMDPDVPAIHALLFEATQSPGLAERHQVRSVPTLLIPDTFRIVGPPDPGQLRRLLRNADAGAFLREQIRHEIQGGQAPEAGRRISQMDDPSFLLSDLGRSTFQERIGLLLALEQALECRPGCLDALVPGMVALLETAETALRGDLAALLGTIGQPEALPGLERLLQDPNPDVAEAAEDAIEEIREKAGT